MAKGNEKQINIVIGAVDRATARIREINKRIAASFPAQLMGKTAKISDALGLGKVFNGFGKVGEGIGSVLSEAGALALKLAAIGSIGAFTAERLISGFADWAHSVVEGSEKLGLTTRAFQENAGAAALTGASAEAVLGTFMKFSRNIGEAYTGMGKATIGFQALEVNLRNAKGLRSMNELLPEVADKLSKITNAELRNAIGAELFGKTFGEVLPFLQRGAAGIREYRAEAVRLGAVMGADVVESGNKLFVSLAKLNLAFSGIKNTVLGAVAPVFDSLIERFTNFLADNRMWIDVMAHDFAGRLPEILSNAGKSFDRLLEKLTPIGNALSWLSDRFGGVNLAAGVVALFLGGKLLGSFLELAGASATLGKALFSVGLRLTMLAFPNVAADAVFFFQSIQSGLGVMEAFRLVLAANPLAVWTFAFLAFANLARVVIENWEPIKYFFFEFVDWIEKKVQALGAWLTPLAQGIGDAVSAIFSKVPKFLLTTFGVEGPGQPGGSAAAPSLAPALPAFSRAPALGPALGGAGSFIQSVNETRTERQEATVRVDFGNLPKGTNVSSDPGGVPLDLYLGYK